MLEDVQYNKGCSKTIVQVLMDSQDLDQASRANEIMLVAVEAAQRIANRLRNCKEELTACRVNRKWAASL
jgi:hypothetical protein